MKCCQIEEVLLTDFLDDRLSSDKKMAVESHLAVCVPCRELVAAARELDSDIMKTSAPAQVPAHVWAKVADKIDAPSFTWSDLFGWGTKTRFVYGSALAGLLAVVMVLGPVVSHQRTAKADLEVAMQLVYADEDASLNDADQTLSSFADGNIL